jgi:hypothetical protein
MRLGRHFVLKGFLNGELYLSYFILDLIGNPFRLIAGNSDFASAVQDGSYILLFPKETEFPFWRPNGIFVEQMRSEKARDEKFETMNREARLSRSNRLRLSDYAENDRVRSIYPHYVWYEQYGDDDIADLPPKEQDRLEIDTTYAPVRVMLQSLLELFEYQSAILDDLEKAIRGLTASRD